MSLWHIAWSYLWNRKLTTAMTILSVALGVGLISAVLTLREETKRRFEEEGSVFDIVVGAKGNPLQLVLSTVYFLDTPTGTIAYDDYTRLKAQEEVAGAFPVAMGDSYGEYRIIGTTPDLFTYDWSNLRQNPYVLASGNLFAKPFEAVVGAMAAENTGLKIGDTFVGIHGLGVGGEAHENHPYTVVGILARSGTPNDRAIFCDIESVWVAHDHGDEAGEDCGEHAGDHDHGHDHEKQITAVMLKLHSPAMRFQFEDTVNTGYNAMATIPVNVVRRLYDQILGTAKAVLLAIGYLVVVISSISILIGLYMSILQRRRDLAIMRALGASRGEIFGSVIIEAFWVTMLGIGAGWCLGTGVCWVLGRYLVQRVGFGVSAISMTPDLVTAYSAVVLMGLVAGILPAWQAYRTNVARDLAEL